MKIENLTGRMLKLFIAGVILLSITPHIQAQAQAKNIVSYGAKADTNILNTRFVQQAIDDAAAAGGGMVIVPAGEFRTGAIELKSCVNLHLEKGAVLAGSDKRKDYNTFEKASLIFSKGRKNISITGSGVIDGRGRELMQDIFKRLEEGTLTDPSWKTHRPGEGTRTNLVYFEECDNVQVKGVMLKDASSWVTHYERCTNVTIDSIRLESVAYWNNDGVDIVDCKNVHVSNSNINASDDAICLKSARRGDYCENILIENCTLRSSANAFKIGTGTIGGFRNIVMRNITVFDTYRSAIALEAVDGGFLENVDIRNVVATNTGNAILIKLGHRNNDEVYSTIKNIYIGNVKVEVPEGKPDKGYETEGPLLMYPPGFVPDPTKIISISPWNLRAKNKDARIYEHNVFPSSISGLPGHPVENVTLENIEITYKGGADKNVNYMPLDSFNMITEATKDYPEFSMFGELPVWGLYVRHVDGLVLKNIKLIQNKPDYRTSILVNDANNLSLKKVQVKGATSLPEILLNNVNGLDINNLNSGNKNNKKIEIRNTH